ARGFPEAATLSEEWVRAMGERALVREAHHTTHIEGTLLNLGHVMEHGNLTIQDYAALCPETNRRTLQRDLKELIDKGLISEIGTSRTDPTKRYTHGEGTRP
ncbi:MAG: hypothetical protein ACLFSZ_08910, partial [Puniceicoccaceae bacterium]